MSEGPALDKILYIDDDPLLLQVAALSLRSLGGFAVDTLEDPLQAVDRARSFRPDLLLLDLVMPGRDGLETLAALRGDPATRNLPLIFLSGKAQDLELPEDAAILGAIAKPFDPYTLHEQLRALWRGKT